MNQRQKSLASVHYAMFDSLIDQAQRAPAAVKAPSFCLQQVAVD